jgi:hypothetical protein
MKNHLASFSKRREKRKAQLKIQEMAFVLVAILIFFSIAAIFYINFRLAGLKEGVDVLRAEEAKEIVRKLSQSPELSWNQECSECIDFDKALVLKESKEYKNFWDLEHLRIELIYPEKKGECNRQNYPECRTVTLVNKSADFGIPERAFIALCRYDSQQKGEKCELGAIYASGKAIR